MATSYPPLDGLTTDQLKHRLEGLHRVLDATRGLAMEIDLSKILDLMVHAARLAVDCERASLFQYDPDTNELYSTSVTELEIAEIRLSADQGIAGDVVRQRKMVNVPDVRVDPRWNDRVDRETGFNTHTVLAAPLISPLDDRLLGVFVLLNNRGGPFDDFDEEMLELFSQHASIALDRARLVSELTRRRTVEAALKVARDIQRGFMPRKLPRVPGYEIAHWWFPHQAVGGDYCDVLEMNDGRLGLVVADVSGHGIGPSLIMASVRAALKALVREQTCTNSLLDHVNQALSVDLQDGRFITMIMAALDPQTHRVEFCNAGHSPALHYIHQEDKFLALPPSGTPLGVRDDPYKQGEPFEMQQGDFLILCTDGIVEAVDEHDEPFGQARLEAVVRRHLDVPVDVLVKALGEAVTDHFHGESPPDDLTVLVLKRVE